MHDTAAIDALRERVKGLSGADREVDALIVATLCPGATVGTYIVGDDGDIVFHAQALGIQNKSLCPTYTESIDAALALVERVLPGVWWLVGKGRTRTVEPLYGVHLMREGSLDDVIGEGEAETPSLAIILALLSALKETDHV